MSQTKRAIEAAWPDYFDSRTSPRALGVPGFEVLESQPEDAAEFEAWLDSRRNTTATQDNSKGATPKDKSNGIRSN